MALSKVTLTGASDKARLKSLLIGINALIDSLPQQSHVDDAKVDYEAGDLDSEAEIITALNATNTILNSILATLEACSLHATS